MSVPVTVVKNARSSLRRNLIMPFLSQTSSPEIRHPNRKRMPFFLQKYSPEIKHPTLPTITLTQKQAQVLRNEVSQVPLRGYQRDPSAREGIVPADPDLVDAFEKMSHAAVARANVRPLLDIPEVVKQSGFVLIRGIDYGAIAPTTEARALHGSSMPEAFLAGVVKMLGCRLVGYEDQETLNSHLLFHDIRPTKSGREGANGAGGLGMHFDLGFRPDIRPNYQILAGLREGIDRQVKTPLISSKGLYHKLLEKYPEDEQVLRDASAWDIRAPETAGCFRVNTPLLTGTEEDPVFHMRLDRQYPLNESARRALDHVQELIQQNEIRIHLETGDLLVWNNHKVLHRRSILHASHCEKDRLLMRVYGKAGDVPLQRMYPKAKVHGS